MKPSKSHVQSKAYSLPELKFENQSLTSFAGLVILQKLFAAINLKQHLQRYFTHLNSGKIFDRATIFLQLVVPLILGYRELQDSRYYRDDPLVKRLLGLKQLPDIASSGGRYGWLVEQCPALDTAGARRDGAAAAGAR